MTTRTLWTIIIKILGIWFILESVSVIPQFFSYIYFFTKADNSHDMVFSILWLLFNVSIYILILYYCLFKTGYLIDRLKLDKGFEEEKIDLNIHRSTILKIAIIVIGSMLFIDNLPLLFKWISTYYQQRNTFGRITESPTTGWVILYLIKALTGYLLMTNSRYVIYFIERQRKK